MRDELAALLEAIADRPTSPQLTLDGKPAPAKPLTIEQRSRLWDLAIKLGRELAAEIDPPAPAEGDAADPAAPAKPRRRARVDYGGA